MEGDAGLAAGRQWRVAIGRRAALDVAGEGHGESEQAILEGLAREQSDGRLVNRHLWLDVHQAAGGADVPRNIRAGGLAGAEGHRDRIEGRGEDVAFLLQDGASGEAYPVIARLGGDESFRVAVVGPMRRTEEGEFDGGVLGVVRGFELLGVQRASIAREEHGLFVSEGIFLWEEPGADEAIGLRFRRGGAGAHRLT